MWWFGGGGGSLEVELPNQPPITGLGGREDMSSLVNVLNTAHVSYHSCKCVLLVKEFRVKNNWSEVNTQFSNPKW